MIDYVDFALGEIKLMESIGPKELDVPLAVANCVIREETVGYFFGNQFFTEAQLDYGVEETFVEIKGGSFVKSIRLLLFSFLASLLATLVTFVDIHHVDHIEGLIVLEFLLSETHMFMLCFILRSIVVLRWIPVILSIYLLLFHHQAV
jgi:hypothetical protein